MALNILLLLKNIIIFRVSITRWNSVVVIMLYLYRKRTTMPSMSSLPHALCTLLKCSIDKIALRSNIMTWVSPWFYNRVVHFRHVFGIRKNMFQIIEVPIIIILLWYKVVEYCIYLPRVVFIRIETVYIASVGVCGSFENSIIFVKLRRIN